VTIIMPAIGTAWSTRYAIKATQLTHLPKRLADPVRIDVWDGKISVDRRVWNLAEAEHVAETIHHKEKTISPKLQD
jgi:hypothetical protein